MTECCSKTAADSIPTESNLARPNPARPNPAKPPRTAAWLAGTLAALAAWGIAYAFLQPAADWATALLPLEPGSHLAEAVAFFLYDTPKVLMLLVLVVFAMGVVRSFFSAERTRALLAGRHEGLGNVAAAGLGIVTPFCSCSAVPLFIGFVSAGVPLGVTFSFLIAAPMVNEIALGLLWALLGWQVALAYLGFGLLIAIVAGWVIGRLHLEGWLQDWVRTVRAGAVALPDQRLTIVDRLKAGLDAVADIVGKVWMWVIAGIAAGALIHGYVPAELLAAIMGREAWWSVPAAVVVGIPMYSNAAGIIPVVEALLGKGAALGTVLAFMMSVIALSAPELIILHKVLKGRLIAVFVAVVGLGILAVGFLFNALFA
ncbi:permease [Blastochloris sulfoviridis]|uniref:Permease n=1 Tax=Blastochloris sulfoviridis TaxID=50712 RepID=A0A5M6HN13_9HYPH|nr:permease [Blastochloris sulfoviridis]KAA5597177.1 permease [Blastochloris sulfoviridis]